ncbi:MAG TPA: DUF1499 domain-containing protein [Alphaproteobacteria bacterium]|nr:DUF1499 domain-containing protein [Alphaproteobacteria bacterium]
MSASSSAPAGTSRTARGVKPVLARAALALGALALLGAVASGLGARLGLWPFRDGFQILRYAAYGGAGAAVLSLVALAWPRGTRSRKSPLYALLALVLGCASLAYPVYLYHIGQTVPRIHDITTDVENPPAFVAIAALRIGAENPSAYAGGATAEAQREAYPEIKPLHLAAAPADVFKAALAAARGLGWEVAAAVPAEGRIEATATSFWYGFKDDVVIRIAADGQGTRVDMRSESRVGRSDFGVNARRVAAFLAALKGRVAGG